MRDTGVVVNINARRGRARERVKKELIPQEMPIIASSNGVIQMQYAGQMIKGILTSFRTDMKNKAGEHSTVHIGLDLIVSNISAADDAKNVALVRQLIRIVEVLHSEPTVGS